MDFEIKVCCSMCHTFHKMNVQLPFDCDDFVCPKCGESNSLSIVSINHKDEYCRLHGIDDLLRIREL